MYETGDIVVLPFPYSDRLAEKRRPALIVSNSAFNASTGLVWLVMITTSTARTVSGDVAITRLKGTGLPVPSIVRPAKIACAEHDRILRIAGKIDPALAGKIREYMTAWINV